MASASTSSSELTYTSDEIEFTNAFNDQRPTLAIFAKCSNLEELHIVRDAFYLGLASALCPKETEPVRMAIVANDDVATSAGTADELRATIEAARDAPGWTAMIDAVRSKAEAVGSDLDGVWMTLEKGRLEWLAAASAAHGIKETLRSALEKEEDGGTEGDVSDAKMVWMYALSLSIPDLREVAKVWREAVRMKDGTRPLVGYNPKLWDCRRVEWAPLDRGVQAAAERGGSTIDEAWAL